MGLGDELLASGMAKGARARGKRIAFGDGKRIVWGPHAEQIFRGNPNVAKPGSERDKDIEWIAHYVGHRLYNKLSNGRWIWNYSFRPIPGEFFLAPEELSQAESNGRGFVLIEPNLPNKPVAVNKRWPVDRFQTVADSIKREGYRVVQFPGKELLRWIEVIPSPNFRTAAAILGNADLYIGPEGGLHHAAAAVGTKAVVLFGGFIPAEVTGYESHINLFTGGEACGSIAPCRHCREALDKITVEDVLDPAIEVLRYVQRNGRRASLKRS
jgi:ADP-heptose:LPS heptosyltransferase